MKKSTLYIVFITFIVIALPISAFASEGSREINIEIMPEDSLFNIDNMKPGDWAPRSIEVKNRGEMDFQYEVTLKNTGNEKLFNEVLLEISDDANELYEGKLADFESLPLRNLAVGNNEDLHVTIRFPEHLGNEFQGLDVHFTLIFTAEGKTGKTEQVMIDSKLGSDDVQKNGLLLPKTATNIFSFILIGAVLFICGGLLVLYNKRIRSKR